MSVERRTTRSQTSKRSYPPEQEENDDRVPIEEPIQERAKSPEIDPVVDEDVFIPPEGYVNMGYQPSNESPTLEYPEVESPKSPLINVVDSPEIVEEEEEEPGPSVRLLRPRKVENKPQPPPKPVKKRACRRKKVVKRKAPIEPEPEPEPMSPPAEAVEMSPPAEGSPSPSSSSSSSSSSASSSSSSAASSASSSPEENASPAAENVSSPEAKMSPPPDGEQNEEGTAVEEPVPEEAAEVNADGTPVPKTTPKIDTDTALDQMVQNCLYFMFIHQNKKTPAKRTDMVRHAMNSQYKLFPEVIKKLEWVLDAIFGMQLVELSKDKDNSPCLVNQNPSFDMSNDASADVNADENPIASTSENTLAITDGNTEVTEEPPAPPPAPAPTGKRGRGKGGSTAAVSYILVSKYPAKIYDSALYVMARRDPEADSKKSVLYLILSTCFMLNRSINEDVIWKIIKEMEFNHMVCEKRDDLRKYLKSEYVQPGYLKMETSENHSSSSRRDDDDADDERSSDPTKATYSWGPRAHMEYSKYHMLKFVVSRFPGKKMYEFTVQYNIVQREEKELIERDLFDEDGDCEMDADNEYASYFGHVGSPPQFGECGTETD